MGPHIVECSTTSLVVLAVQKLCRHEYVLPILQTISASLIGWVVVGVYSIVVAPRVDDLTVLWVVVCKERIYGSDPSSFIAIAPERATSMLPSFISMASLISPLPSLYS